MATLSTLRPGITLGGSKLGELIDIIINLILKIEIHFHAQRKRLKIKTLCMYVCIVYMCSCFLFIINYELVQSNCCLLVQISFFQGLGKSKLIFSFTHSLSFSFSVAVAPDKKDEDPDPYSFCPRKFSKCLSKAEAAITRRTMSKGDGKYTIFGR